MTKKIDFIIYGLIIFIIGTLAFIFLYNPDKSIKLEKIVLDKKEITILINEKRKINVTFVPENATDKAIKWTSSNPSVAIVNEYGIVSSLSVGETDIIVSASNIGIKESCHVTVTSIKGEKIILSKDNISLKVGEKTKLDAIVAPDGVMGTKFTFKSSNSNIVTVDKSGNIEAKNGGTAEIIVTDENKLEARCKVSVIAPSVTTPPAVTVSLKGISLNKTKLDLLVGHSESLIVTFDPDNYSNKTITWESSNPSVATINENGLVTAKSNGTAIIKAKSHNGKVAKCEVRVLKPTIFNIHTDVLDTFYKNPTDVVSAYNKHCNENKRCDLPRKFSTSIKEDVNIYRFNDKKEFIVTTSPSNIKYYLIPNNRYYIESKSNSNKRGVLEVIGKYRFIYDDIRNFRDLGGWAADGGKIKYGRIYRSATTDKLSENTIKALNLSKIVDLRENDELESPTDASKKIREMSPVDSYDVSGTRVRNAVLKIIQAVVDNKNVLFNCHWGKDRTGTVAYVIEGLLGTDLESRLEDYDLTWLFYQRSTRNIFHVDDLIHQFDEFEKKNYEQEQFIYWFLKNSSNKEKDLELLNNFRKIMIDGNPHEYKLSNNKLVLK